MLLENCIQVKEQLDKNCSEIFVRKILASFWRPGAQGHMYRTLSRPLQLRLCSHQKPRLPKRGVGNDHVGVTSRGQSYHNTISTSWHPFTADHRHGTAETSVGGTIESTVILLQRVMNLYDLCSRVVG
jgi:hypothetical protein